jgi:hypothetical protein
MCQIRRAGIVNMMKVSEMCKIDRDHLFTLRGGAKAEQSPSTFLKVIGANVNKLTEENSMY